MSPSEAAVHKATWHKGQKPWMAVDPGKKNLLTIELFTEELVYLLKLGHGSLARLYQHQRELDRARSDRTWLVVELRRLEGGGGEGGGLAYKMQVEGLLEKTKVTKQREWHFMKAIQRKLHGTCLEFLVALHGSSWLHGTCLEFLVVGRLAPRRRGPSRRPACGAS